MPPTDTLDGLLRRSAEFDPNKAALIRGQASATYGRLDEASDRLARGLRELGVERGDRVALVLDNGEDYVVSYYGILKAGAAVVPLCPDTRPAPLAHALSHAGATAVILDGHGAACLSEVNVGLPSLRVALRAGPSAPSPPPLPVESVAFDQLLASVSGSSCVDTKPDDLASIVFTSGTTGPPKGVALSHRNLVANTKSIVEYLALTRDDVAAVVLPFFYVYGNSVLHTHICAGGTLALVGSVAFPAAVFDGIARHRCTGLAGVPSTFAWLVEHAARAQASLSSLRYVTQAGGPMTPALTDKLRRVVPGAELYVMYGQTEASARLTYLPPDQLGRKLGSVGKAIPGVTLAIVDSDGAELPRGTVGEICARGDNVMMGYWNDPEETRRVLRPEGLRTGDLGWMDDDGYIYIQGRAREIIKSGAHRIGPKEIEDAVEALAEVRECAVVGVPDDKLGEAIAAFVVPSNGEAISRNRVMLACHERLPRFKLPRYVVVVESLPRTPSGKLRRADLKGWFAEGRGLMS